MGIGSLLDFTYHCYPRTAQSSKNRVLPQIPVELSEPRRGPILGGGVKTSNDASQYLAASILSINDLKVKSVRILSAD